MTDSQFSRLHWKRESGGAGLRESRIGPLCVAEAERRTAGVFEDLSDRLGDIFDRLRKRGALSEADVSDALREVRVALLEADVALPVVKDFISGVRGRAIGQDVLRSVTPAQMVVKIVHDHLDRDARWRAAEGGEDGGGKERRRPDLNLAGAPPVALLLVGLQGSGKTTTAGKIAHAAAQARQEAGADGLARRLPSGRPAPAGGARPSRPTPPCLPIVPGEQPVPIALRAMEAGRTAGLRRRHPRYRRAARRSTMR